jgi:hypothetical protein
MTEKLKELLTTTEIGMMSNLNAQQPHLFRLAILMRSIDGKLCAAFGRSKTC